MASGDKIRDISPLKQFSPLDELEPTRLTELAESALLHKLTKGQSVSAITEKNQTAYLLSGEVIRAPGAANAERIKAGSGAARQPLVSPNDRNRVVAEGGVTVLCVDADLLDLLRSWGDSSGLVVDEIDTSESGEWIDSLMQSDVVLSLSPTSIQVLMSVIEPVEYPAGKVIFKQGDVPDYYYIVSRGECRISRRDESNDQEQELALLSTGDAFGEEALIANSKRNATATMLKSGMLLRLDRNNFKNLLEQNLVHVINMDRAERLKAKGAMVLDVRPAHEFARDGKGINIPFSELRDQIDTLSHDKQYLVISDDNRASAIAAFLLGQKQLKVWVMQAEAREEVAAKAAQAHAQARELEGLTEQLQHELEQTQQKLTIEQQRHAASHEHIKSLENELRDVQKTAHSAIVEASSLKNKTEAMLRNRISELGTELEREKQQHASLIEEAARLQSTLVSSQENTQESLLQGQFNLLQREYDQLQHERQVLAQQLDKSRDQTDQALADVQVMEVRQGETQDALEKSEEAYRALEKRSTHQAEEIAATQQQLEKIETKYQILQHKFESLLRKGEQQRQQFQKEHEELERSLERSQQAHHQTKQRLQQLDKEHSHLTDRFATLEREAQSQALAAQSEREVLNREINTIKSEFVERQKLFNQAETEFQQSQSQLKRALKRTTAEKERAEDLLDKERVRNKIISDELARLQDENRRSGRAVKTLVVILVIASIFAAIYYLGIDVQELFNIVIMEAGSLLDQLMEKIPLPFK